jgi:hypothetical protein
VRLIVCFLLAVAAFAQTSPTGLEPTWDIAVVLDAIGKDTARLLPVLDQVNAPGWVANGASDTYVSQLQSSKDQARAIAAEAKALTHNPEKLSAGLQLFFRFEGLETMLVSLEDATRKYQSPQVAQALASTFAESGANRERFRSYIVSLAAEREHQFEVMDQEAQRCRATLTAPTPAKTTKVRKK